MKIPKNKATRRLLEEDEVLEILGQFGLARTKRQLRYILDKGDLQYKVVQENNLIKKIKVSEAQLYVFIVKRIPALREILPIYEDYIDGKLVHVKKLKA